MNTLAKIAFAATCTAMIAAGVYYEVQIQKIRNKRHGNKINQTDKGANIIILAPLPTVRVKAVRSVAALDPRVRNLTH